jgi:hypothetical protein
MKGDGKRGAFTVNRVAACVCLIVCLACSAWAHEHWVDLEDFHPAAGATSKVFVCSGHGFPKSSTLLKKRLLHDLTARVAGGEAVPYEIRQDGKRWTGEVAFKTAGVSIVSFSLKRPPLKEPLYQARTIVVVGGGKDDETQYGTMPGLIIVPGSQIHELKKGDELPLTVLYNGERVKARLTISPAGGRSSFLRTTTDRAALLKINKGGRYLVTTDYKGKGASLLFSVKLKEE